MLTPKMAIVLVGLLVLLVGYLSMRNSLGDEISPTEFVAAKPAQTSAAATFIAGAPKSNELKKAPVSEGIFLSADKQRVSVNVRQQRLIVVQRLAEVAGFYFSLPDNSIEFWVETIDVTIDDQPIAVALSEIIGNKNFTLEMAYDSELGAHKISAVLLVDNKVVDNRVINKNTPSIASSPVGTSQPLPQERNSTDAPTANLPAINEQQIKRENFYAVDEAARLAILREMSPVGDDLRYIVTSLRQDKSAQVRALAAQRLAFSENYGATQSLIEALSDKDPTVVQVAVESLVSLGDASIIPAMEGKLSGNENGKVLMQEAAHRIQSRFALAADSAH